MPHQARHRFCSRLCIIRYSGPTDIEMLLSSEIEKRHIDFEEQYPILPWVIDFAIPIFRIAIEADGTYWHSLPNVQEKDARKDADLQAKGWTILHFTGDQIRDSVSACVDQIEQTINSLKQPSHS